MSPDGVPSVVSLLPNGGGEDDDWQSRPDPEKLSRAVRYRSLSTRFTLDGRSSVPMRSS